MRTSFDISAAICVSDADAGRFAPGVPASPAGTYINQDHRRGSEKRAGHASGPCVQTRAIFNAALRVLARAPTTTRRDHRHDACQHRDAEQRADNRGGQVARLGERLQRTQVA